MRIWRIPLGILFTFELLTLAQIFPFQPYYTALGLTITSATAFFVLEFVYRKMHLSTRKGLLLSSGHLAIVAALYIDAIGDYAFLYQKWTYYDTILHLSISFAGAWYLWNVYKPSGMSVKQHLWNIVTTVVTFGVLYELEEYVEDVITGSNRLGDGFDTANDLLMDVLGACVFVVIALLVRHFHARSHVRNMSGANGGE